MNNKFPFALRKKQIALFKHISSHRCHSNFFVSGGSSGGAGKETFKPLLYSNPGIPFHVFGMS